jgi:hypothetical protein
MVLWMQSVVHLIEEHFGGKAAFPPPPGQSHPPIPQFGFTPHSELRVSTFADSEATSVSWASNRPVTPHHLLNWIASASTFAAFPTDSRTTCHAPWLLGRGYPLGSRPRPGTRADIGTSCGPSPPAASASAVPNLVFREAGGPAVVWARPEAASWVGEAAPSLPVTPASCVQSAVLVSCQLPEQRIDTIAEYQAFLTQEMAHLAINQRLFKISRQVSSTHCAATLCLLHSRCRCRFWLSSQSCCARFLPRVLCPPLFPALVLLPRVVCNSHMCTAGCSPIRPSTPAIPGTRPSPKRSRSDQHPQRLPALAITIGQSSNGNVVQFRPQAARCCFLPSANPKLRPNHVPSLCFLPKSGYMEETSDCSATASRPHPSTPL